MGNVEAVAILRLATEPASFEKRVSNEENQAVLHRYKISSLQGYVTDGCWAPPPQDGKSCGSPILFLFLLSSQLPFRAWTCVHAGPVYQTLWFGVEVGGRRERGEQRKHDQ
jgi:hypothetical protein